MLVPTGEWLIDPFTREDADLRGRAQFHRAALGSVTSLRDECGRRSAPGAPSFPRPLLPGTGSGHTSGFRAARFAEGTEAQRAWPGSAGARVGSRESTAAAQLWATPPPAVPRTRTAARASQPPRERLCLTCTEDDADRPVMRKPPREEIRHRTCWTCRLHRPREGPRRSGRICGSAGCVPALWPRL